jgi:hypothetical protein
MLSRFDGNRECLISRYDLVHGNIIHLITVYLPVMQDISR